MPLASVFKALDRASSSPGPWQKGLSSGSSKRSAANVGRPIVFISTMTSAAWGGSEELWAQAALRIRAEGLPVGVSVHAGMAGRPMLRKLDAAGAQIQLRRTTPLWSQRIWRRLSAPGISQADLDMIAFLAASKPALVVFSDGNCMMPVEVLEYCVSRNLRFATIGHMTSEYFGIDDVWAARYRSLMPLAQSCYFVSKTNLQVFERQVGCRLPNSEIVLNPFKVDYAAILPWPKRFGDELRLAHVGRLHPPSKGQDLLLEALSQRQWRDRAWRLTLYGDGSMREVIEKLSDALRLTERVTIQGFVESVEGIWAENHALVMPSRYEGLPLAMVEAMLCGRPVLATDVGGHAEIIEDDLTGFIADSANLRSVSAALERLWERRDQLETMGRKAACAIRAHVPPDPVGIFVKQLKTHACIEG